MCVWKIHCNVADAFAFAFAVIVVVIDVGQRRSLYIDKSAKVLSDLNEMAK